jgi:DMSO reductase anchor subunit
VLGVALLFLFGSRITGKWRGVVFVISAVLGAVPAAWEFIHTLSPISQVYGSPAVVAWGSVVTLIGFVLVAIVGWTDNVKREA